MSPRPGPVDDADDDDAGESWKHDDPAERSPLQRKREERAAFDANQRDTFRRMSIVWAEIQRLMKGGKP